jgi:mono/diheme cytochrome c family protein
MRQLIAISVAACGVALFGQQSSPPALFTAAQAKAAVMLYQEECGDCHSMNLTGGTGPALTGDGFWASWNNKTARNLYSRILTSMPQQNPGSLTEKETLYLVVYILQGNGYPAGETPLTSASQLDKVVLERLR